MVPATDDKSKASDVQDAGGATPPAAKGEANNAKPAAVEDVPIQGSPGGVYRIDENGRRVRVTE